MERRSYPVNDRCSWLWLAISTLLGFFTYGVWLVPLMAWVAPIFTIRFLRSQPPLRGFVIALPITAVSLALLLRDVVPMSGIAFGSFVVVAAIMGLLPYLLDRVLGPRLPAFAATLVFPLAMVSLELLNALGPWGTWGSTAYTQAANLPLTQVVSVTGLWGIVFLVSWLAPLVNWAWEQGWRWERVRAGVSLYAGVLALVVGAGYARLAAAQQSPTVRVAGIPSPSPLQDPQAEGLVARIISGAGSAADLEAARELFAASNAEVFARSAAEAEAGARIIFWAEGSAAVLKADEAALVERGTALAREQGVYLGMAVGVLNPEAEQPLENKIVLLTPEGTVGFTYHKAFPVPGTEAAVVAAGAQTLPTLDTPYGRIGAAICFDMDHHSFLRQASAQGVDLLFAPANTWPEIARTHADMARMRAIENGFALLRPTNNGLSIATDGYGRVLGQSDYWRTEGGSLVASIPTRATPTLYGRIGDSFAYVAVGGLALLALWALTSRLRLRAVARPEGALERR